MNTYYDPNYPGKTNSEMFSDMFIAWNFKAWNTSNDPNVQNLINTAITDMTTNMAEWIP
jgi:hypothetical protein